MAQKGLLDHQVLVSAALVAEEAEAELHRSVGLRELPPARFLRPVRLSLAETPPRPRRALGLLARALAVGSVAIAGYWLVATWAG
jgi:ferric-dicitrate binding protein FerR (iron transport regulator)